MGGLVKTQVSGRNLDPLDTPQIALGSLAALSTSLTDECIRAAVLANVGFARNAVELIKCDAAWSVDAPSHILEMGLTMAGNPSHEPQ